MDVAMNYDRGTGLAKQFHGLVASPIDHAWRRSQRLHELVARYEFIRRFPLGTVSCSLLWGRSPERLPHSSTGVKKKSRPPTAPSYSCDAAPCTGVTLFPAILSRHSRFGSEWLSPDSHTRVLCKILASLPEKRGLQRQEAGPDTAWFPYSISKYLDARFPGPFGARGRHSDQSCIDR